jgi:hypothetical protein
LYFDDAEDVGDRDQVALREAHVADGGGERQVFQRDALALEAVERQRDERSEQRQVEILRTENVGPSFDRRLVEAPWVVGRLDPPKQRSCEGGHYLT